MISSNDFPRAVMFQNEVHTNLPFSVLIADPKLNGLSQGIGRPVVICEVTEQMAIAP